MLQFGTPDSLVGSGVFLLLQMLDRREGHNKKEDIFVRRPLFILAKPELFSAFCCCRSFFCRFLSWSSFAVLCAALFCNLVQDTCKVGDR